MSFAYMPLYTGDFLRATRHLSPEEVGIYLLLLMHSWDSKGPVPLDERKQCGLVNARSGGEIESLRRVLAEYFVAMDDGWYNKRIFEEIERWNAISFKRAGAAKARWSARQKVKQINNIRLDANALQVLSKSNASGPSPSPSPSPSLKNTNTPPLPPKGGDGFAEFWSAYPRKTAKANAVKAFLKLSPSADMLRSMIAAVRQQAASEQWRKDGGQFIPHPATWLNGRRWEDEAPSEAESERERMFRRAL